MSPSPAPTTVSAHMFHDIVRKLADGAQVSLEIVPDTGQLLLRSGRSRFSLQSLPAADFPDLTTGEFAHKFELPALELRRLIENAQFAISTEETRYYLNGIYFHTAEIRRRHDAARGGDRRPSARPRRDARRPQGAVGMPGVIAPRKAVAEILKLLEDPARDVTVEISQVKARFRFGDVTLTTKLIDGAFPDYNRVIPLHNDKRLVVDKDQFQRAVDRVSTISSERGRAIKLSIADNRMMLSRQQSGLGFGLGGDRGRLRLDADGDRLQLALPPGDRAATLRRHGADQTLRSRLADDHHGSRRRAGALCADAVAGVTAA